METQGKVGCSRSKAKMFSLMAEFFLAPGRLIFDLLNTSTD
jgi:hypothetical protein